MFKKFHFGLTLSIFMSLSFISIVPGNVSAQDVVIEADGKIITGTSNNIGNLKVVGNSGEHAVAGLTSGTGAAGIYGKSSDSGNYGALGTDNYGVYGNSISGYAGYFFGNARVTGNLTVDGTITGTVADHDHDGDYAPIAHIHSGNNITGGTILEIYVDPAIARDSEIMPTVLANDGPSSGLDADTLDGVDSSGFSTAADNAVLETRVSELEAEEAKSFVTRSARAVSDKAYTAEPELEIWIKAAQKGNPNHPLGWLTEIDTDGDGVVTPGTDLPNVALAASGVVTTYIASRVVMGEVSPWNGMSLWASGGAVANQADCNAFAAANPGQITLCYFPAEDNTIKAIFVSAYDNEATPNLIYAKSVTGYSDIERRDFVIASAKEGVLELEKWIKAVQKGSPGRLEGGLTEIDTDGDGVIIIGTDMTNEQLAMVGVINQFIASRVAMGQVEPWYGNALWAYGGAVANQMACDVVAVANPVQITLCYTPAQDNTIDHIFVSAYDSDATPNLLYSKTVTGTTDTERRESIVASAKEELAELKKWMAAARKGGTVDGSLTEVDTDGDGVVTPGTDLTNDGLAAFGVITTYTISRRFMGQVSPWPEAVYLWSEGGVVANQFTCNTVAVANPGQITLCYLPAQDNTMEYIFISVHDSDPVPNIVYSKTIIAD